MSTKICLACRSKIDLLATRCPHCRSKQPKSSGAGLAALLGVGFLVTTCTLSIPGKPDDPTAKRKVEVAADIGDSVAVQWPATTIMCTSVDDRDKVFMAGKFAFWDKMRTSHSDVFGAVKAEYNAREETMKSAYSCRWAPDSFAGVQPRFTVVEKKIIGTDKDMFHTVNYCLQPEDKKARCWWVVTEFGEETPFEHVHPKTVVAEGTLPKGE
jgi:hypothetical protein